MASLILGGFMFLTVVVAAYYLTTDDNLITLVSALSVISSYFVPLVLNLCYVKCFVFVWGILCYIFLVPTFINIFVLYAIGNIHDISWGNRPSTETDHSKAKHEQETNYEVFRANVLFVFILVNTAFAYAVTYISRNEYSNFLYVFIFYLLGLLGVRLILSIFHRLYFICINWRLNSFVE